MKLPTILLAGAILTAGFEAAVAQSVSPPPSAGIMRCALWVVPGAYCSLEHKMIGGAAMLAAVGTGIGAIWAAAGTGAIIGGSTGIVAPLIVK